LWEFIERIKNFATEIAVYTSLILFVTTLQHSECYGIHTTHSNGVHLPHTNLAIYQQETSYGTSPLLYQSQPTHFYE
jgi:hypothetical protein